MRRTKFLLLMALAIVALVALGQSGSAPSKSPGGTDPTGSATVNPTPQSSLLRILTPVASQTLANNVVDVRFELTNPAASAGTPNFQVQLDGNDPVRTSSTQQTFTGLGAGPHTVTVILVDANDTPVPGGRAAVQFIVGPQTGGSQATTPRGAAQQRIQSAELRFAGFALGPEPKDDGDLPGGNSSLPLISVIGFGVLVGGIVSALRTR